MTRERIANKRQMYAALERGDFGNTIPMWTSAALWELSQTTSAHVFAPRQFRVDSPLYWGVRSMTPGGPCRLYCPRGEVVSTFYRFQRAGHDAQISVMVDAFLTVTSWMQIWRDSPTGLHIECITNPPRGASWRALMPSAPSYTGIRAQTMLRTLLNGNSYDDLEALFELYPDHVIELSTLSRCYGTLPNRNAIIWEVRGDY